jgi:hypothetical protein
MVSAVKNQKSYIELSEHNKFQLLLFFLLVVAFIATVIFLSLPLLERFFMDFLNGNVFNKSGTHVAYSIDQVNPKREIHYLFSWAVDVFKKTSVESRYWFNPALVLFIPSSVISVGLAIITTALLPQRIGFMHQKVERVIVSEITKIATLKYGYSGSDEYHDTEEEIQNAGLAELQEMSTSWNIDIEDLRVLQKALLWNSRNIFSKALHINDGLHLYMRSYFTVHYSNIVLGFVYIGAAVLIIIVGLRGLKFIPPAQPTFVLLALALEFSLLLTYAFTLMYSKQEEEGDKDRGGSQNGDSMFLSSDFGSSKDIEKLLRVFLKTKKK